MEIIQVFLPNNFNTYTVTTNFQCVLQMKVSASNFFQRITELEIIFMNVKNLDLNFLRTKTCN